VAFNKNPMCGKAEIAEWARMPAAQVFCDEITVLRDVALRRLVDKPCDEYAQKVKVLERVLALFEEAKAGK
jgi:hypothetical protein